VAGIAGTARASLRSAGRQDGTLVGFAGRVRACRRVGALQGEKTMKRFVRIVLALACVSSLGGVGGAGAQGWEEGQEDGQPLRILLLRTEFPPGFHPSEKATLESDFVSALLSTGAVHMVSRDDMPEIAKELKFQASDMVDEERAVELGRITGASHLLTLVFRAAQGQYHVSARLTSVETGETVKVVVRRSLNRFDFLSALCGDIAYEVAGVEQRKGAVRIETEPPGGQVFLFGIEKGKSPLTLTLAPGNYLFEVKKAGYQECRKTLEVRSGEETPWRTQMVKKKQLRLRDYIGGKNSWGSD